MAPGHQGVVRAARCAELHVSNDLIGDYAALRAAWERDGYWFFRDVLDHDAVARLRASYVAVLAEAGVIDPSDADLRHNGADLSAMPPRMAPLSKTQPWRAFIADRAIHAFFARLLDDEPFWIPIVEYRAAPPNPSRGGDRINYLHQDGFYNDGIPFCVAWIPLSEIDEDVGGVVLAEGMHHGPYLHDLSAEHFAIPEDAIPEDRWRRATYRPGDVLLMDPGTPHSGLLNQSDRFRLSMDIRVMPRSGQTPAVGTVAAVDADSITVDGQDGLKRLLLDDKTFVRVLDGRKFARTQIPETFPVGSSVIVAAQDGVATVIRPPHV